MHPQWKSALERNRPNHPIKSMDGSGGRGNSGNGGNSTSGKKRATRSKTAAAQAQAQAQAAATASTTTGANSGGKKSTSAQASGGNNKPNAAATAEKKKKQKNAVLQSGNQQQQQQQSDQPKKKKKKRRLHAGAVAAKAAAKAAEAAAAAAAAVAAGTVSLSSSSPRSAAAGTTEGKPAVAMKQPPRGGQLVVTGKNIVPNAKATLAPSQSSSSVADNAAKKPKTASLKPAKKKQKMSQQQQQQVNAQQATQETSKQQKQQHAQARAPPMSAPVPGSVPKPKTKAKRKIAEVSTSSSSVQVTTPASAPKQNTLRQPAAHARAQPPSTQSAIGADAPVSKKSKIVVLKRKPAQAPSEPSSVAAADGSPAAASLVSKQVVAAPAPKQDNIPKTISLAATAASTTTTIGDGNHTVPDSASRMNQATTSTTTTVELIEDTNDEEKVATHETHPTTASSETQTTKSVPSPVNSVQNILDVQEANSTVRKAPTTETAKLQLSSAEQATTEAFMAQHEDAATLKGTTTSEQSRALDSSDPVVAPATQTATPTPADAVQNVPVAIVQASQPLPLSLKRSDLVSEWVVNASSPSTKLEFEADEAFFQPQPLLTSSATEDINVLTLPSPSDHAEEDPSLALTDSKSMKVVASPASSPRKSSVEMTVKEGPDEILEAPVVVKLSTDDSQQPGAEARSSTVIKPLNVQNSREFSEEETKEHEPPTTSTLPPPVPVNQAPSKSGATLAKQTEASHSAAVPRNPIVEPRLRLPSKIEIPPPQLRQKANAWGASFGMAITPDHASVSSSSRSSLQLLTSQTSPALATSPLSSWFLSKGHANFVQHVSFPPRSVQHHRRRSLSPRKHLSATNNAQAIQVTQKPADEEDDDDHLGSSGNAFLESLTQRSDWRTWYGSVNKKDLLDPPLQHVPVEVRSAIDKSAHRVSESVELASSSGAADDQTDDTESIERQRTKTRSIELLEAEIRAEKARARAFDQELLRMLQSGSALPSQM